MLYFGFEAIAERAISIERWVHPDRHAAFLIFCAQEDVKLTTKVINERTRPFTDEIGAHPAKARERLGSVRVADKDIAGKTAKVWHVMPSSGEMVLFAGLRVQPYPRLEDTSSGCE